MKQTTEDRKERIRNLNDALRTNLSPGTTVITRGIAALGPEKVARLLHEVATFERFTGENDPYGEHDFGAIDIEGQRVFFKIDYYSTSMDQHSPDPSDPAVTQRVMTIMRAEEY